MVVETHKPPKFTKEQLVAYEKSFKDNVDTYLRNNIDPLRIFASYVYGLDINQKNEMPYNILVNLYKESNPSALDIVPITTGLLFSIFICFLVFFLYLYINEKDGIYMKHAIQSFVAFFGCFCVFLIFLSSGRVNTNKSKIEFIIAYTSSGHRSGMIEGLDVGLLFGDNSKEVDESVKQTLVALSFMLLLFIIVFGRLNDNVTLITLLSLILYIIFILSNENYYGPFFTFMISIILMSNSRSLYPVMLGMLSSTAIMTA